MLTLSAVSLPALAVPLQVAVDPIWFVTIAVGVFLAGMIVGPLVALRLRETRDPTPEERDRVDNLLEGIDNAPDRIHVVDTTGDHSITVSIRGLPGRRSLLVSDSVLGALKTETASALLAAEVARSRYFYIEYRAVAAASVIGIATAMFGGLLAFSDGFGLLAVTALGLFWVGRQLQFRADRAAADRVGGEALAEAFETVATVRGVDPEPASWRTWFEVQPPLGQRVDHLRRHS